MKKRDDIEELDDEILDEVDDEDIKDTKKDGSFGAGQISVPICASIVMIIAMTPK